jgi:tetratricopeptide (TPR) repeat protein
MRMSGFHSPGLVGCRSGRADQRDDPRSGRRGWQGRGLLLIAMAAAAVALAGRSGAAQDADRIVRYGGLDLDGTVEATTPRSVDITLEDGESQTVPVEEIREIQFFGEPQELRAARSFVARGRPADALDELAKLDDAAFAGLPELVLVERKFVTALATARAALAAGDDVKAGGKLVSEFLRSHTDSFHFYLMQEVLGDLLARASLPDKALDAYAKVAEGPAAMQVRAASARARILFDQKRFADAAAAYDQAAGIPTEDPASAARKREALLGKARCLAASGKAAEAVALAGEIIAASDPEEEEETLAAAFNTLGGSLLAAGRKEDALVAFLTVDLVYNTVPNAHAEALLNLVDLWNAQNRPERAREAAEGLRQAYPGSAWAKLLPATGGKG